MYWAPMIMGVFFSLAFIWLGIALIAFGWRPWHVGHGYSVNILPSTPGRLIGRLAVNGTRWR